MSTHQPTPTQLSTSLSDSSSYMDYTWKFHHDSCGSDHFSTILEITWPIQDLPVGKQMRPSGNILKPYAIEDFFKTQITHF